MECAGLVDRLVRYEWKLDAVVCLMLNTSAKLMGLLALHNLKLRLMEVFDHRPKYSKEF